MSRILSNGDVGASSVGAQDLARPVADIREHIPKMLGFHRRYMNSNKVCRQWANMVRRLDVEWIVSQHGPAFKGQEGNAGVSGVDREPSVRRGSDDPTELPTHMNATACFRYVWIDETPSLPETEDRSGSESRGEQHMFLNHVWGLLTHPEKEWKAIRKERAARSPNVIARTCLLLAAIPAVAGYLGTIQVGSIGRRGAPEFDAKGFLQETPS